MIMPGDDLPEITRQQAIGLFQADYAALLISKATQLAIENKGLPFDPQGRVLLRVSLTEDDLKTLQGYTNKETLEKSLGRSITDPTVVSLDISGAKGELRDRYNEALKENIKDNNVLNKLAELPKGSVIALQQEFYFHLGLHARTLTSLIPALKDKNTQIEKAHQNTMLKVNKLVMAEFAKALDKAWNGTNINLTILNQELDKARETILPKAYEFLRDEIALQTGVIITSDLINEKTYHKKAETMSATVKDVLHTDISQGLAVFIGGSDHTAHNRILGTKFAHRQLITIPLDNEGNVNKDIPLHSPVRIRTPSLDVKELTAEDIKNNPGLSRKEIIVKDIVSKVEEIKKTYDLANRLNGGNLNENVKPKAFIYNLHTSFYTGFGSSIRNFLDGKNKQTKGAENILQGVHDYNKKQILSDNPVYCFVQNIPVNGSGDTLGYDGSKLRGEATLMAELALMHTLYNSSNDANKALINKVMKNYSDYLKDDKRPKTFFESIQGKASVNELAMIKANSQDQPESNDTVTLARGALQKLVANNLHLTHEYAKLVQSLSVFVEEASASGCKSANERAQYINGRVALFDSIARSPDVHLDLSEALWSMARGKAGIAEAKILNSTLNITFNGNGIQAANSVVSLVDQGAPSKVVPQLEAKGNNVVSRFFSRISTYFQNLNTNRGEESAITNQFSNSASSMQAHNKSVASTMKSVCSKPLSAEIMTMLEARVAIDKKTEASAKIENNIQRLSDQRTKLREERAKSVEDLISKLEEKQKKLESDTNKQKIIQEQITALKVPENPGESNRLEEIAKEYNLKKITQVKLSDSAKKILYGDSPEEDDRTHRMAFDDFLKKSIKDSLVPDAAKKAELESVIAGIESGKLSIKDAQKAAVQMKNIIGPEGVEKYKAALLEERNSRLFKEAVLMQASQPMDVQTPRFKKRFVAQILGPAGVGKTSAMTATLELLNHFMEKDEDSNEFGNEVVSIDGGDPRDISLIRQQGLKYSLEQGYSGIEDLYDIGDKKKILGSVKDDIEEAVRNTPKLNAVIPTTSNRTKKLRKSFGEDIQEVIVQVMGEKEVIEYQSNARAFKTWVEDNNSLPGSKAPTFFTRLSRWRGNAEAKSAMNDASPDALKFIVINDSIVVKQNKAGEWERISAVEKGSLSISSRIFDRYKSDYKNAKPLDFDALKDYVKATKDKYAEDFKTIITTPELYTLEQNAKTLESSKDPEVVSLLEKIKELKATWDKHDWKSYQVKNDNLRDEIQIQMNKYPPITDKLRKIYNVIDENLGEARKSVPKDQMIPVNRANINQRAEDAFAMAEENELGFKHTKLLVTAPVTEGLTNVALNSLGSATSVIDIGTPVQTKFENVQLNKNEIIRSCANFGEGRYGILTQNHRGKVTDMSTDNLTEMQKTMVAIEAAQMVMINWRPGNGPINLRGTDVEQVSKVYAALLMLKEIHPQFKNVEIKSYVKGCKGPGPLTSDNRFINQQLKEVDELTREKIKQETSKSIIEKKQCVTTDFKAQSAQLKQKIPENPAGKTLDPTQSQQIKGA